MAKKKTTVKKVTKKIVKKKAATKKAVKKATKKKTVVSKAAKAKKRTSVKKKSPTKSGLKKASVKRSGNVVPEDKKVTRIVFTLDEVEALVATRKDDKKQKETDTPKAPKTAVSAKKKIVKEKRIKKRVHGAASLADILGFNPAQKKKPVSLEKESIPKKWMKFYKLLVNLRQHVQNELDLHTMDTLKHSSPKGSGKITSYGNHQADAGIDAFDRDFALSLVSSEQDALKEIGEAILRIKEGTYGICEVTGKPINKKRLEAVPFARYSIEGQKEYEKSKRQKIERTATDIFTDTSEAPKIISDDEE